MQLFKMPVVTQDLTCTTDQEGLAARKDLLDRAGYIQSITSQEVNDQCAAIGSDIQRLLKGVEAARKDLTSPYLAAQRAIKATADAFSEPLETALTRLGRLASAYRLEQERKAEAERQARAVEIQRLQEAERKAADEARKAAEAGDLIAGINADILSQTIAVAVDAAVAAPEPVTVKTQGQSFQARTLAWECTDPVALWNARPDLCIAPAPKASAIRSICTPEHPIPGLRLWWESKVNFKSR
jgi:hypothetical protein